MGNAGELTPRDFAAWYEQCHDRVLAGVRVTTRDSEHARDAVSEAFTRAFSAWDRVAVMERPEAWVYRVAINVLRRRGRRAGTERRLLRQLNDREIDAVSEAFTRAFSAWDRVAVMERPEAWVYTVAINVLRRRGRRAGTERRLLGQLNDREIDADPVVHHDVDHELWDAVSALPPRQRHAVALRYVLGFSQHEVAAAMGITDGTAASTLAKARASLAARLGTTEEIVP